MQYPEKWEERFNAALVLESERAIRQRDEFLKTGKSTAGHGGSHDTAFSFIVRQFMKEIENANNGVEGKPVEVAAPPIRVE